MTTTTSSDVWTTNVAVDQIRAVIAEKAQAHRDQDADRVVALYAPDVAVFNLAPPLRQPTADALDPQSTRDWFNTFEREMDYRVEQLHIEVAGDLAFCHCLVQLSAIPRGQSAGFSFWFRMTLGLRRTGDTWLITHEHESTPFHMDGSFRAAVDLEP